MGRRRADRLVGLPRGAREEAQNPGPLCKGRRGNRGRSSRPHKTYTANSGLPHADLVMAEHERTSEYGETKTLEPVLTINETADLLHVSRGKVYELIRAQE